MKQASGRGQTTLIIAGLILVLATLGVAGMVMRGSSDKGERRGQADTFAVRRGGFDIIVPVTGELAALRQIEIRNNLDGRAVITEIVSEGQSVKTGDVLLRLNDEDLRNKLRNAQDKVNVAEAAATAAQANLDIKIKARESDLAKADLAIMLADLALKAWQEGEDVSKRQALALAVETAQKEYDRLDDRFKESGGLLEKKFIALDEYKRDEIAMIQAKAKLEQVKLDVQVYEKYQFEESKAKKESDLKQARDERERVQQKADAEVRSAQSDLDSKRYQLESEKEKLAELQTQLSYCTVKAPSSGLVVYASSLQANGWGRNEGKPPQVGTELTRNETVIVLPDTSEMVASVKVSEALSGQIQAKQSAVVISDAIPDRALQGEVLSVGVLAETGGWRDPNRRDYTVRILLKDAGGLGLKPSMRCKADIRVGRVDDALHMPVQAVFRNGPVAFAYVPQDGGYAQRKLSLGRASELYIETTDGVNEGEIVLLREPSEDEIVARLEVPKTMPGAPPGPGNGDASMAASGAANDGTAVTAGGGGDQPGARGGRRGQGGKQRESGKPSGTGGAEAKNAPPSAPEAEKPSAPSAK